MDKLFSGKVLTGSNNWVNAVSGSRYVSWLPSFSVEVTHTSLLPGQQLRLQTQTSQLDNMVGTVCCLAFNTVWCFRCDAVAFARHEKYCSARPCFLLAGWLLHNPYAGICLNSVNVTLGKVDISPIHTILRDFEDHIVTLIITFFSDSYWVRPFRFSIVIVCFAVPFYATFRPWASFKRAAASEIWQKVPFSQ